mgnify:CR=1 FL=1
MRLESQKLLSDASEAAQAIEAFTRNKSFDDLVSDKILRSAVYYQFVIVGEALARLARTDEPTFQRISESSRIVGFRNQIIHGYGIIQDNITWQIIQDKLPVLLRELKQLLTE